MKKIIVAGGRDFKDYFLLSDKLDFFIGDYDGNIEIVSGGQVSIDPITKEKYGADYFGEVYAEDNDLRLKRFPADWNGLGKKAGPIRNRQMAEYADYLVAFWDGYSKGTANMIELAFEHKLKVRVVAYQKDK